MVYDEIGRKFRDGHFLQSLNPSKLVKIFDLLIRLVYQAVTKHKKTFKSPILNAIPWDMEIKDWMNIKDFEREQKIVMEKAEQLSKQMRERNEKGRLKDAEGKVIKGKKQLIDAKEESVMDILYP